MFADKLKQAMQELSITQAQLPKITGIGRSSISQYLSGKNEPTESRKTQIASALGLVPEYFTDDLKKPLQSISKAIPRLTPEQAAAYLGLDKDTVRNGLKDGVFPWGYAIKGSGTHYVYYINANRFAAIEGITL